jgi:iron complex outermembrane receptor protein
MRLLFFLVLLCAALPMSAQQDSVRHLPAVELSAQRLSRYAVGQRAQLADSIDLASFRHRNLSEFLAANSPLDLRLYSTGSSTLSVRGGSTAHTAFIWNGVNIQNPLSGLLDLSLVPMGGISQMGYKTGGESALFGSGALTGVVFWDTEAPQVTGFHGDVSLRAGSFGDARALANLSYGSSRFSQQLTVAGQKAENNFPFQNTAAIGRPVQRLVNAQQRNGSVQYSATAYIGANLVLKTNVWHQVAQREIPPTMTAANVHAVQDDASWRGVATLFHRSWLLRLALTDDQLTYRSDLIARSSNRGQNAVAEWEQKGRFGTDMPFRWGINFTQNTAKSNNYEQTRQRSRAGLFASQTLNQRRNRWHLSLRQELVGGKWTPLTGSMGLERTTGEPVKGRSLKWRSSIGRNFNLPALNDLYWVLLGNPDLRPESSWSAETGADWSGGLRSGIGQSRWQLSGTAYAMRIRDRIQWAPGTDGLWRPNNLYVSDSKGIELAAEAGGALAKWRWLCRASYQFTHATGPAGKQLLYVPKHIAQGTASLAYGKYLLRWRQVFNGSRPMTADNSRMSDAFALSNVEMRADFKHFFAAVSAENVFDRSYQLIQYYPMAGRAFYVQMGYVW